jgi:hypothetical protein
MPFIMPYSPHFIDRRAIRGELVVGLALLGLGLTGVMQPYFLGLNLTALHGLLFSLSGTIAIWGASSHHFSRAFVINTSLGFFFAALAIAGPYLKGISSSLVFTPTDHLVRFLFATALLTISLTWKRYQRR